MKRLVALVLFACCLLPLCAQEKEKARLKESYSVLKEILGTPDKGIPRGLQGSTLRSDDGANRSLYGREFSAKEIVREGKVKTPQAGKQLIGLLEKISPKHAS